MILSIIETQNNEIKKSAFELATFAQNLAKILNSESVGLVFGNIDKTELEEVGKFGFSKIYQINTNSLDPQNLAQAVSDVALKINATEILLSKSSNTDSYAGRLAAKLGANLATNIVELPTIDGGLKVKSNIYTGKAYENLTLNGKIKILVIKKNAIEALDLGLKSTIENFEFENKISKIKVVETIKTSGDLLLTEAEIVVSGGLGMKGPENWHLIEGLAKVLHAATGCSKPVSDKDWRPHHEHVGQTGIKVSPNIYIAVGISGAIQHLAGVNSSKVIVVINKDPEAPFFKAADYGIVGDAFDILPKLTAAAKNYVS